MEDQINGQLRQSGMDVSWTRCEDDLPARVGASVICRSVINGQERKLRAVVTRVADNKVYFDIEPVEDGSG